MIKNILKNNEIIKSVKPSDEKWSYIFKTGDIDVDFPNLNILVEYIMCIPG